MGTLLCRTDRYLVHSMSRNGLPVWSRGQQKTNWVLRALLMFMYMYCMYRPAPYLINYFSGVILGRPLWLCIFNQRVRVTGRPHKAAKRVCSRK